MKFVCSLFIGYSYAGDDLLDGFNGDYLFSILYGFASLVSLINRVHMLVFDSFLICLRGLLFISGARDQRQLLGVIDLRKGCYIAFPIIIVPFNIEVSLINYDSSFNLNYLW